MVVQEEHRLTIPAVLENVEKACRFVAGIAQKMGMSDETVHRYYLAIEEICTNIIEHGYKYEGADAVIDVICREYSDRLSVTIIDDAKAFDPLIRNDPDPATPLSNRRSGGWGIYFVKKYMDEVTYSYENNRNHLTLEKNL
jgi:sigma-B regulation protein RsbU (phosphoserine phosphatase)